MGQQKEEDFVMVKNIPDQKSSLINEDGKNYLIELISENNYGEDKIIRISRENESQKPKRFTYPKGNDSLSVNSVISNSVNSIVDISGMDQESIDEDYIDEIDGEKKSDVAPDNYSKQVYLSNSDDGRGWACVFACFVIHVMIAGYGRSYGLIYTRLIDLYGSSAAMTAWVNGSCSAIRMGCS